MIGWQAHLAIDYTRSAERTVAKFVHKGPLRLLQSLYPEGYALARKWINAAPSGLMAGVTSPHPRVVVLRTLSPLVEPAKTLLRNVWSAWRKGLWDMGNKPPRIWAM
ncbi:MAG: hypothetical protein EBZ81_13830 [Betaproteobacteria bacterium]|nr:hypothetical protein [Betaproteobacteria bacterium]